MKKLLFLSIMLFFAYAGKAQITKGLAIKGGLNVASQNIQWSSTSSEVSAISRWQFGVSKNFKLAGPLYAQAEMGYAQMGFEVDAHYPSAIHLDYLYAEGGLGLEKKFGFIAPFLALNYRYGHLLEDNMREVYFLNRFSKSDHGINIKAGLAFPLAGITPFIEAAYYHGVKNLRTSSVLSTGDTITNENYNRSFSLMLGIRF